MGTSYNDKRSVTVQLTAAGMDARQAEDVANVLLYGNNPAVTRTELIAARRKTALGIVDVNILLTVVLIRSLQL